MMDIYNVSIFWLVNNGTIHIHIQNFLFICFNFIPRNGISGSYSNSIINVLSNWPIVWHSAALTADKSNKNVLVE